MIPLKLLAPGQVAQVGQLVGEPHDVHRLEELGIRTGAMVEMVQSGTPCIIRLNGAKLCFRDCDVFQVLVTPGDAA
jgi:Fe2+ transport system protein FeoA